ncbi:MAG: J domain-containing protein [Synechococcaceae cyanobacterium RL_1_2]|nr:J domain-containing protein [Synechococcaceae cyanobacterium RL_1_2]
MAKLKNYYEILAVPRDASPEMVKRAFRQLARRYHPDVNPGDRLAEEKFKDLNEAYEILSDPNKREQYNQYTRSQSRTGRSPNGAAPFRDFNPFGEQFKPRPSTSTSPRPEAIRDRTANAYRPYTSRTERVVTSSPSPPAKRDIEARLALPLERAYRGGRERIRLEDGRSLEVDMPPGLVNNQKIRLKGQGINNGDLYLKITVAPHDFFDLDGQNVICAIPITPSEAILGAQIEIPTLDGLVKMSLPPGVKQGQKLRLANKGYPSEDSKRGDQLVEINIVLPTGISPQEKELYEKIRELETFNPRKILLKMQ